MQAQPPTGSGVAAGAPVVLTFSGDETLATRQRTGIVVAAGATGAADGTGSTAAVAGRDFPTQLSAQLAGPTPAAVDRAPAVHAGAPVATPEPLARQLAGPIATLATGPHGDRTLTINVAPDGVGPVSVRAHLGAEGLRVELLAPTDAGREALRHMLPDLKRDLAGLGAGTLSLSAGDKHDGGSAGARSGDGQQHSGQPGSRHPDAGTSAGRQSGPEPGDGSAARAGGARTPDGGAGTGPNPGGGNDPLPGNRAPADPADASQRRFQSTAQLDVMA